MKKGFTLIEIIIVVVVIGIMLAMIPFRMQSLQNHTKFSLDMQQWEETWERTINRMRQGNTYASATIALSESGILVSYSGGVHGASTEMLPFVDPIKLTLPIGTGERTIIPYALGCAGYNSGFKMSLGKFRMCYRVDTDSCNLIHFSCNNQ